jgi:lysozyme family protein
MQASLSRRSILTGGTALLAWGAAAPLCAQDPLRVLLGDRLPEPLRALLPREAQEAAQIVGEVMKLEREARLLRLPASPLSLTEGTIPTDPDRLYEAAMPRLVALIDRAERKAPVFAEKAGGLLARLHQTQYRQPEVWLSQPPGMALSLLGNEAGPALDRGNPRLFEQPRLSLGQSEAAAEQVLPPPDPAMPPAEVPVAPPEATTLPGVDPEPPPSPPDEPALPPISPSLRYEALAYEYVAWFAAARIRSEHQDSIDWHLAQMRQARPRYSAVGKHMGVPWYFIAAIHGLEASFNFRAHLHNGDFPLTRRTRQVPAGRPLVWLPPSDWEASAADALRLLGFAGQTDWSLPRTLYRLEAYNGFGYRRARRPSPYLWSFSTLYDRGKFVADGRYDPRARSQQCGAAVMLKLLALAGEESLL